MLWWAVRPGITSRPLSGVNPMTKQAPHVVALKVAFSEHYALQLNARLAGGARRDCLVLTVPAFKQRAEIDRTLLIDIGIWLESRGYFLCHDYGRVGLLSSPSGWTCWDSGVSVMVRHYPPLGSIQS